MKYEFCHGSDLCEISRREGVPISEIMMRNEMEKSERTRESITAEMKSNLDVMRASIREGLEADEQHRGIFVGGDAAKLMAFAGQSNLGTDMAEVIASAMAVVEYNASMGKIVAAPTAGASGILPAVLIVCGEKRGFDDDTICRGLFTAGAIGCIIAKNASIAGASGGCQAETGSAAAMAAGALAELCGANPETVLHASAIALKNIMGLVCDPVGGLVECPCVKRNAIGAANAVLSCDLALAGIRSLIPFDEVVDTMKRVGDRMHADLKETARGGLAAAPTAQRLAERLSGTEA
ncbi:MAG: L-serine ammonia-lyase, iron-sulfur-dependent, subunit alpha [Lachnospiraceae bacterium]|nr:L-serine ammonia-lyase, iron-sulfur-dependent, subunit alpha [Lachnospiraceae bacterium]